MNNEAAFPNPHLRDGSGMTLRDYFAAKAMQGMLAGLLAYGRDIVWNQIAEDAYKQADAMLKQRTE
jgi:hypothetical protein